VAGPLETKVRVTAETRQAETALSRLRGGVRSVGEQLAGFRNAALGLFGLGAATQSLRALAEMADGYSGMVARLRIATRSDGEFRESLAATRGMAKQYQAPLRETATLFTRVLGAVRPLGGGVREAGVATQALLASLRVTGATTAEASSAILQFSQALGAGALRGEEFNSIAESAPALLDALARGLGKPRDELRALAEQGALTTNAVVAALGKELPRLQREAAAVGDSIAGAAGRVKDAWFEFVGSSSSGSAAVASIVGLMKLLAENIGLVVQVLGSMAGILAALKLGAFAQALVGAGAAAAAGATGVTAFGLALRGALAVITGPVGFVVALGSLALAWLGLRKAQEAAAGPAAQLEALQKQRAVLAEEVARREKAGSSLFGSDGDPVKRANAQRQLRVLDGQIDRLRQSMDGERELEVLRRRGRETEISLDDPKSRREFKDKYKARAALERELAEERARFVKSADREIESARAAGDAKTTQRLLAEKRQALAEFDRNRAEQLGKFNDRDQATRIAQAKESFDQELELLADAIGREKQANEQHYQDGLTSLADYLARRKTLEEGASTLARERLLGDLQAERTARQQNEALLNRGVLKPNDRAGIQEAIAKSVAKEAELQAEITRSLRDQVAADQARARFAADRARELAVLRRRVEGQLADAEGRGQSRDELRARALDQFATELEAFRRAGDREGEARVLKLVDATAVRAELAQVERDFSRVQQALAAQEEGLRQASAQGRIGGREAEAQILDLRRQQVPVLDDILARIEALASTDDDKARVGQLRLQLRGLADFRSELEKTVRGSAINELTGALNDIGSGAKTAKGALLDMVQGFAAAMLHVLNQRLATKLVDQMLDAAKNFQLSSGGGGGFLSAIGSLFAGLFHSGGVVGRAGGVARAVSPALFAFAPRYHSGGIAGLRQGELPAILKRGEEVITEDDPRHVRNLRSIGGLRIETHTTINGAGGTDQGLRAAGEDFDRQQRAFIERWAAEQLRPGGILAARGRG
jgi:tape measure domain-containing protein